MGQRDHAKAMFAAREHARAKKMGLEDAVKYAGSANISLKKAW